MQQQNPTHLLCDIDGVIRREKLILPGTGLFFSGLKERGIVTSLLSNNSRQRGGDVIEWMKREGMCLSDSDLPHAISSADATAMWLQESTKGDVEKRIFLIGEQGIRKAIEELGIPPCNDDWDGNEWKEQSPTHVVCGFTTSVDYKTMSGAWNAINSGAQFIGTNPDLEYRNAMHEKLPANGAMLAYLQTATEKELIVIGKPGIFMAEQALSKMGATKEGARVVVIGDTINQDVALAESLEAAGWNVRMWMVASGVTTLAEMRKGVEDGWIDNGFDDIREITEHLQSL